MKRRQWDSKTKAKIVLEGLSGKPVSEVCTQYQISYQWWGMDMTKAMTDSGWVYVTLGKDWYTDTERMMRTLKGELIWLREWRDPYELDTAITNWIESYNATWLHMVLGYRTPNRVKETYNLTTRTPLENAG